ncbi:MAG TPA: translation initiation factor IF-2 N-terminal domain-containing protein, partial [Nitrospiraceae bacterium]|nr:translation initiation factor IF-2 N-terminal domain-containing protein [Nitrospiraceae bacterium]
MRVYELAKKLGMENRDLIPELKRLGIAVASHSSTLDDEAVRLAFEKIGSKVKSSRPEDSGPSHDGSGHGPETRRAAKGARDAGPHDVAARLHGAEEATKPDKKRILIKRKKEEGVEDVAPPASVAEPGHPIPPMSQPASLSAATSVL